MSDRLTKLLGTSVPLMGQIPLDIQTREAGDAGTPVVLEHPESAAALELLRISRLLASRQRGLAGRSLGVTPK